MLKQYRVLQLATLALGLPVMTGCQAEKDRAEQRDAVEYTVVQHNSAQCAGAGLLPGSAEFNTCMNKLQSGREAIVVSGPPSK